VQRLNYRSLENSRNGDSAVKKRKTSNGEKRASAVVIEGTDTVSNVVPPSEAISGDVFAQLEFLKSKLHELESKVHDGHSSHASSSNSTPVSEKKPLDWEHITSSTQTESHNPTFIGINLYNDMNFNETINFYAGYAPVHVQDLARRYNHGPFSWLTLLKKVQNSMPNIKSLKSQGPRDNYCIRYPAILLPLHKLTKHRRCPRITHSTNPNSTHL